MVRTQHNHETVANTVLAELLSDRGLDAEAEIVVKGRRPDIVITRDRDRIYLETEYEPASTVDDDAKSRLRQNMPKGASVRRLVAFAIKLPDALKSDKQKILKQRFQHASLELIWRVWYASRDPKGKLRLSEGASVSGNIDELARAIRTVEAEVYDLENAVDVLQDGASEAGDELSADTLSELAKNVFKNNKYKPDGDEQASESAARTTARLSAIIVINAMMFQERISHSNKKIPKLLLRCPPKKAWREDIFSKAWDEILGIDYSAIFEMAYDIMDTLNGKEAQPFLESCVTCARRVVELTRSGSHDLSGRIFNKLVEDRKFVKAYYTRIPTATLLAGLALAPHRWEGLDWEDAQMPNKFRVIDPACGTGTLLMAAYKQIEANAKIAELNDERKIHAFHKTMVEVAIHGFDVEPAAVNIAAATVAYVAPPKAVFEEMNFFEPKFGIEPDGAAHLGSLDFFDPTQSKFEEVAKAIKPLGIKKGTAVMEQADLIIANPPYTRFGASGKDKKTGKGKTSESIFGQFSKQDRAALTKHLSEKLRGTGANQNAGLATAFIVLADSKVKPNGRIAFVLPSTALTSAYWADLRRQISERYAVEFVISAQVDKLESLSFETHMNEVLLIARKLKSGEQPPREAIFVNLSSAPADAYEASLLVSEINKIAKQRGAIRKISDAPVGGAAIGGKSVDKQWGEALIAPVGAESWSAALWKIGVTGQYVWNLYSEGVLWNADRTHAIHTFQLTELQEICNISPTDSQSIKGARGPFEVEEPYDDRHPFAAMWHLESDAIKSMLQAPNAGLIPKSKSSREAINKVVSFAGHLQIAPELRYNAQSYAAVYTEAKALGVRSWFTLTFKDDAKADAYEKVMALWLNSTLGLCCQIAHSTFSQFGRGTIGKTGLLSLPVLDVTKLNLGELNAAQKIWDDLKDAEFKPFHRCDSDKTRIELDNRLLKDVFGLGADALEAITRIRELLVQEPRVHGGRKLPQINYPR